MSQLLTLSRPRLGYVKREREGRWEKKEREEKRKRKLSRRERTVLVISLPMEK